MTEDNVYLTREGYQKLSEELELFKTTKRRQIAKALGEARAHGDLSENAEYDAAKNEQALNEKRIAELSDKLARARILDDEDIPSDEILLGAIVKLKDLDSDEEFEYIFVSEVEADYSQNKISIDSPIGKGLLGHKVNEVVEIEIPAGVLKYKVLNISR